MAKSHLKCYFLSKNDELKKTCSDLEIIKGRITQENVEITRQLEEQESKNSQLMKAKKNLEQQMEELKKQLEDEMRVSCPVHKGTLDKGTSCKVYSSCSS